MGMGSPKEFVICHLRMVIGHLLTREALPWAVLIDAPRKLTVFPDEVLNQGRRGHPSFQNPKNNDKSPITDNE
jgi:hypothetical protein